MEVACLMKRKTKVVILASVLPLMLLVGYGGHFLIQKNGQFKSVTNQSYKSSCGECHLAYPPDLLPAASWEKILLQLGDHFGENVVVDGKSKEEIGKYLMENAAGKSPNRNAARIVNSIIGEPPLRITDVPLFKKTHREVMPRNRDTQVQASMSDCLACHKEADQGNFDD
jgi:hypothetical protein